MAPLVVFANQHYDVIAYVWGDDKKQKKPRRSGYCDSWFPFFINSSFLPCVCILVVGLFQSPKSCQPVFFGLLHLFSVAQSLVKVLLLGVLPFWCFHFRTVCVIILDGCPSSHPSVLFGILLFKRWSVWASLGSALPSVTSVRNKCLFQSTALWEVWIADRDQDHRAWQESQVSPNVCLSKKRFSYL